MLLSLNYYKYYYKMCLCSGSYLAPEITGWG